jgi:hypothetical protein
MTLNELSRYYWARMNQASYMDAALRCHEKRNDEVAMYCLLNWVYYKDIGDEIKDESKDKVFDAIRQSRGEFK